VLAFVLGIGIARAWGQYYWIWDIGWLACCRSNSNHGSV